VNNLIISVEGTELTGKTSLISDLHKRLPDSIPIKLDAVISIDNSNVAKVEKYINNTAYKIMNLIKEKIWLIDRFIISGIIYSKFLNRPSELSIKDIKGKNYKALILVANPDILLQRYQERNDKYFNISQILNLNNIFFNFFIKYKDTLRNIYLFPNNNRNESKNIIKYVIKMVNNEF